MDEKIYSGIDRARELGMTYREFVEFLCKNARHKPNWGQVDTNSPIKAIVAGGRWLAECECGGTYYVEPTDPLAFCDTCGNLLQSGKMRPVVFPPNRVAIEATLLERKMVGDPGTIAKLGTQAALFGKLVFPAVMPRNWDGETPEELRAQHAKVKQIMTEMKQLRKDVGNG
jgi:hypothetical protein